MWFYRMVISDLDYEKLMATIERARRQREWRSPHLELFEAQLRRARVVPPSEIPYDLITMGSEFELVGPQQGETSIFRLTYPDEPAANGLSVLTPMGRAVLASRVGDEVGWFSAAGPESARVMRLLEQPESQAAYGLVS